MNIKKNGRIGIIFLIVVLLVSAMPLSAAFADSSQLQPQLIDNLYAYKINYSSLVPTDSGYMRVDAEQDNKKIQIEYYDTSFNLLSKKSIDMELDLWGGFFNLSDGYYIVEGQTNLDEIDDAEVIRVIKYNKSWVRQGAAQITGNPAIWGGEIRRPFRAGTVDLIERGNRLCLATGHEGYVDEQYNQGHQGLFIVDIDKMTMTGRYVEGDYWHSFSQHLACDNDSIYLVEESEGSYGTVLSKIDPNTFGMSSIKVLEYGGERTSAWAVATRASADGIALSANNVLAVGSSIDQTQYDNYSSSTPYNIYLTVTPKNDFTKDSTKFKWLTDYTSETRFDSIYLLKVNDNRFVVLWQESVDSYNENVLESNGLHYILIDGNGNKIGTEHTIGAYIANCKPSLDGNDIVFHACAGAQVAFYKININSGELTKKIYNVAGEYSTWNIENGTLTISGSGAIYESTGDGIRRSIGYSDSDIKKIVVEDGITEIPDEGIAFFSNVSSVEIGRDVKTIGNDAFWNGWFYYDDSHVVYDNILVYKRSDGHSAVDKLGVRYGFINQDISGASIELSSTSFTYDGNAKEPAPTSVKLGDISLVDDEDYTVSYKNNINAGTATVTISGCDGFIGAVSKTFSIDKLPLSTAKASIELKYNEMPYTGGAMTQSDTTVVQAYVGGKQITLKPGVDYEISYKNNIEVGTATMTVTGIGNYSGSVTKTFKIVRASISNATVDGVIDKTYTGLAQTQTPTVKFDQGGSIVTLKEGTDYTLSYKNNINTGTATMTITGKGIYGDTKVITFRIMKNSWAKEDGKWCFYVDDVKQTGWISDGGKWYYMGTDGAMMRGWQKVDGKWYYLGWVDNPDSGAMRTGWVHDGSNWYYMSSSGAMMTGWIQDGGTWYYLKGSGAMAANEYVSGYWLNPNGSWTYQHRASWRKSGDRWWYGDTSGWYAANVTYKIDGVYYSFDSEGWLK
ncbi:MAG: hypothetical protein J5928_02505 [Firmicutes bacterium]|nr:hypothetical protein [Bacillota bacterium]